MPATSIFMSALSAGMSGIGYSRSSVLLGPVRTAANTLSIIHRVSHARALPEEPQPRGRRRPRETLGAGALRADGRKHGARHRARERAAGLSAGLDGRRVLERGTKALPLPRVQAARRGERSRYPARLVSRRAGGHAGRGMQLLLGAVLECGTVLL